MTDDGKLTSSDHAAILVAQLTAATIRRLGLGLGSNLPGRLARKLSPTVLSHLSAQTSRGVIAVTGTNGKSTTSGILSSILRTAGFTFAHNRQGANLVTGITASLIESSNWKTGIDADLCLFEIDEAALPVVAKEVKINSVVVTNLFRDQLDRFGELDTTARLINAGINLNNSMAILNSDDPNVSQLAPDVEHLFFGLESLLQSASEVANSTSPSANMELSYCSKCGKEVSYSTVFYGQIGHWYCQGCGFKRPQPTVIARDVEVSATHSRFKLVIEGKVEECVLPLPGLFNVYNALAAAAAAYHLGASREAIRYGLKEYSTLFGRSERMTIEGKSIIVQLIKNPAGATQALASCVKDSKARVLIAINDNLADGRDISWLWDADFEQLAVLNNGTMIVSGQRAEDMAVRLKYAGIGSEQISTVPKLAQALRQGIDSLAEGETLWLMPTYTNLLDLQKILKAMGYSMNCT
ncbi:Mur ligase family protein [bacterium]|nr:Mur ligase family protein [bacterium]